MKVRAKICYDGSAYSGWQKQINGTGIQSVVEEAVSRIHKQPASVTASGRTDAGVHAMGQVIHFDRLGSISARGYYNALNTLLPKDIRITRVEFVDDDFHARFSARGKVYEYVITNDLDDPFNDRCKLRTPRIPDLARMEEGARILEGEHDFTSFTHAKIEPEKPRTKKIRSISLRRQGLDTILRFEADGFLRYQVRMMTGTLLALSDGRIESQDVRRILEARDKEACKFNAPAQGLYLMHVEYDPRPVYDVWPPAQSFEKEETRRPTGPGVL